MHFRPALVLILPLLISGVASARQKVGEQPRATSSGPTIAVPEENADPGVVSPNTQGNNNTANDRSNSAAILSPGENQGHSSKKHKAAGTKEAPQSREASDKEKSNYPRVDATPK